MRNKLVNVFLFLFYLICLPKGGDCFIRNLSSCSVDMRQSLNPAEIMEKYGKAVVLIATIKNNQEIGLGSGFIARSDGIVITNYHVIEGSFPAIVKTKAGDIYEDISIIDFNERQDIAILKIKAFDLPVVNLGNSNDVKIGERIVVIGNPHGLENTISDGLLSQVRDIGRGYYLHQISAPISAGSSGSPVFNQKGEVIGIATLSDTMGQNLNFSVPINYARGMVNGPVKYTLKEFSGLQREPSLLSETTGFEKEQIIRILNKLNGIILNHFRAWEGSFLGYFNTIKPHSSKFIPEKYSMDQRILFSNVILKAAYQDLSELNIQEPRIQKLKNTALSALKLALDASDALSEALGRTALSGYGIKAPNPDWNKAATAIAQFTISNNKYDKYFITDFIEIIKDKNPKLESNLSPYFVEAYEKKDKTTDEIAEEDKKHGHLGIQDRISVRIPTVLMVVPGSPAEKAGIQIDDVLLGIENGPMFQTEMDFRKFLITTKPGETHLLKIKRGNEQFVLSIKLN